MRTAKGRVTAGQELTGTQVDELLRPVHDDTAVLRRHLVDEARLEPRRAARLRGVRPGAAPRQ